MRIRRAVGVVLLCWSAGCTAVTYQARVWRSGHDQPFPENAVGSLGAEHTRADLEHLEGRDIGLAFSGGGSRAASAALGELRAMHALSVGSHSANAWAQQPCAEASATTPWIDRVKYISSVSGGTWLSAIYTFLPDTFTDCDFLGYLTPPGKLSDDSLHWPNGAMAKALDQGFRFDRLFGKYFRRARDETWARAIGDSYLDIFGLNDQR